MDITYIYVYTVCVCVRARVGLVVSWTGHAQRVHCYFWYDSRCADKQFICELFSQTRSRERTVNK